MMYLILIVISIFAIWTSFYAHSVKKQRINKLMDNIIKYEKKKAEQQKSKIQ
jgi:amino acid permease